ncbi:MAG TPA: hypothetical protein VHC97_10810 [Thermoanaerobaculia bacterium]|jgi:hypothetical protein|nr:hypothetical protein [Thermoanaerobaculia bacterium]
MTETLWVVGGEQRISFYKLKEWSLYKKALVVRVADGRPERVLEYESPPEHCPDEAPSQVFKAATIQDGTAWLCTQTEVLVCDFPSFEIRRVISHPWFNDLHHVVPAPGGRRLFVAVTGLDAVAELTPEGELIRLVSVLGGSPWDRFSPDMDYRKVPTTKPHQSHPNYVFFLDGQPWVTRFQQRDAVPLDGLQRLGSAGSRPPFDIAVDEGIHDGHIEGDRIYFTTVNGCVIRFNLRTGRRTAFDLNRLTLPDDERPLGWCRGVLPQGSTQAWVGFSRIRYTTLRRNLSWIRHGFRETEHHRQHPTRISLYDLRHLGLVREVDLEPAGMGAVFSIHRT